MPSEYRSPFSVENFRDLEDEPEITEDCGFATICAVDGLPLRMEDLNVLYIAHHALRHRGPQFTGMTVLNGPNAEDERNVGTINTVINTDHLARMSNTGPIAIAHGRWATHGVLNFENGQPVLAQEDDGDILAVAINGNIPESDSLRFDLAPDMDENVSDTRVLTQLLHRATGTIVDRTLAVLAEERIEESAFAGVFAKGDKAVFVRDKYGLRPSVYGKVWVNGRELFMVASETIAFDAINAETIAKETHGIATIQGELLPGMIMQWSPEGIDIIRAGGYEGAHRCVFEPDYFMHPDSKVPVPGLGPEYWPLVRDVRHKIGYFIGTENREALQEMQPDYIIGIPNSGMPATRGFAEGAGLADRYAPVLARVLDIRSFTQGTDAVTTKATIMEKLGLNVEEYPQLASLKGMCLRDLIPEKLAATHPEMVLLLQEMFYGKKIVNVDDSIVQGNSVMMVNDFFAGYGAKIEASVASMPPVKNDCRLGAAMKGYENMLFNKYHGNFVAMAEAVHANRLIYPDNNLFVMALQAAMRQRFVQPVNEIDVYPEHGYCGECVDGCAPGRTHRKMHFPQREVIPLAA